MSYIAFLKIFYAVFLTSIAVGPVFITISSIGLLYGLKHSSFAVIGVIIGNCIYLLTGALVAKQIINTISPTIMMLVSFFASLFLAHLAYNFWKKDLNKLNVNNNFDPSIRTILKMIIVTLSSPVVISGYTITFLTFGDLLKEAFISGLIGGLLGATIAYSLVAIVSGIIGNKAKKIDQKKYYLFLKILNKLAGLLLGSFAFILIVNFIANLTKLITIS